MVVGHSSQMEEVAHIWSYSGGFPGESSQPFGVLLKIYAMLSCFLASAGRIPSRMCIFQKGTKQQRSFWRKYSSVPLCFVIYLRSQTMKPDFFLQKYDFAPQQTCSETRLALVQQIHISASQMSKMKF